MKVTYLDLDTGKKATAHDILVYELTEGDWSCDCNCAVAFGNEPPDGCQSIRYVVIDVELGPKDLPHDSSDAPHNLEIIIQEANSEYLRR